MPLKSWIDARSPSNSSFQSFCSEGAAAAGLSQEIGQNYLITKGSHCRHSFIRTTSKWTMGMQVFLLVASGDCS